MLALAASAPHNRSQLSINATFIFSRGLLCNILAIVIANLSVCLSHAYIVINPVDRFSFILGTWMDPGEGTSWQVGIWIYDQKRRYMVSHRRPYFQFQFRDVATDEIGTMCHTADHILGPALRCARY